MSEMDGYAPVRGKCMYWREALSIDDKWDRRVKEEDRRVTCTCFVEGMGWQVTVATLPEDCPNKWHCRYYIKNI